MEQKSAFITIIGRPNVGKSSLLNKIVGQKVAIVSDKPQTTRTKIMGVVTQNDTQLVFIDTPGFHRPHNLLGDSMIKAVKDGLSDVDGAVFVVDACPKFKFDFENLPPAELNLLETVKNKKLKCVLVINKIDLLKEKEILFDIITAYSKAYDFDAVIPVSAKSGDGIDILIKEIKKFAKPSPHFFADDDFTDQPEKVMVAEIIREKILHCISKEIPHGVAVDIEKFYETDASNGEPLLHVDAVIYCEKNSHKGIIIGKGGEMLKKIGTLARRDIENFFGTKTSVKLWVKVKEDWRNRQGFIHTFGLDNN